MQTGHVRIQPDDPLAVVGEVDRDRLSVIIEVGPLEIPVGILIDDLADLAGRHVEPPQRQMPGFPGLDDEAFIAAGDEPHDIPQLVLVALANPGDHAKRFVGAFAVPDLEPVILVAEADADETLIVGDPLPHARAPLDALALDVGPVEHEPPHLRLSQQAGPGRQQQEPARRIEIDHIVTVEAQRLWPDIGELAGVELDHHQPGDMHIVAEDLLGQR